MGSVKTLHVVGYKNSDLTTLITRWVRLLKEKGFTVSVVKHHGHGAKLDMPDAKKDSMQYLYSGADVSLVAGGGYTQHMVNREEDFTALKQMATWNKPDIILVEGYKKEQGEKVVLVRRDDDWEELKEVAGITLVVGFGSNCPYPQIESREREKELDQWLLDWLESSD